MKKLLVILLAFMSLYAGKIEQIKDSGKLKIGIKYNTKPFGYKEDRKIKGFDIDLAKMVAKEIQKELKLKKLKIFYKKVIPANREEKLIKNKVDMIVATYTITDERKKKIDFSIPYYKDPVIIVSKTKNPKIVGVLKGSTTKKLIEKLGYTPKEYLDYPKMFSDFEQNKIGAISTNKSILNKFVKNYHIINTGVVEEYGIGLPKDKQFKNLIDKILMKLKQNGKIDKLNKKWFGE